MATFILATLILGTTGWILYREISGLLSNNKSSGSCSCGCTQCPLGKICCKNGDSIHNNLITGNGISKGG